ncbi:MAG: iron chaperone [Thermomicrobiales bacterium]
MAAKFGSIDEYIASFPDDVQIVLQRVREIMHRVMPGAAETISYDMPTIVSGTHRVYFGGWKKHLAIYAVPPLGGDLEDQVAPYRSAKDTVQFPYKQPIPYDLIEEVAAILAAK